MGVGWVRGRESRRRTGIERFVRQWNEYTWLRMLAVFSVPQKTIANPETPGLWAGAGDYLY